MIQKLKARFAGLFAIMMVSTLMVAIPKAATAAIDIPVTRTDVSDVGAYETLSHKDGSVTAATCGGNDRTYSTKTVTSTGAVLGTTGHVTTGIYRMPVISLCDIQKAVGKDGTLYGSDPTLVSGQNVIENIVAYTSAGVRKWGKALTVPGCASGTNLMPQFFRMGSDGNLYVIGLPRWGECGGQVYLYSFKPSGVLRWQVAVGTWIDYMNTYKGNGSGVAVFTNNNTIKYYGYDGVQKGQVTAAGVPVGSNASGMLVTVTYGYKSVECGWPSNRLVTTNISGYTAAGRTLYYEPTCAYANAVTPLANGGVAYGGDGYADSVNRIITLTYSATTGVTTAKQILVWSNTDGQRTFSGGSGIIAETNGNILTFRRFTRDNGQRHGMQFVLVRVADGARTTVFTTDSLDTSKTFNVQEESISLSPGRLHFTAIECGSSTCSTLDPFGLFSVPMAELGMDYPRGNTLGVAKVTFDVMAVAGDSFSSGLGSLNGEQVYEDITCQQSPNAYGHNLANDPLVALQMPKAGFLACSGAETEHLLDTRFKGRAPQIEKIPTTAKVVALTIGGNDAKFPRFAALCIFVDCDAQTYKDEFAAYLNGLDQELAEVYRAILARAPNAHVYVIGYPHLLPFSDCNDTGETGWWTALKLLNSQAPLAYRQAAKDAGLTDDEATSAMLGYPDISGSEQTWSRTFVNQINLKVSDGVDQANAAVPGRVHFVSTTEPGSPMVGHQLCSEDPFYNGLDPLNTANMFHPNFRGQIGLYETLRNMVAAIQPHYVLG